MSIDSQDNVYLLTRDKNDEEVVTCLDVKGGKQVWRSEPYPAPYKVGPGEGSAETSSARSAEATTYATSRLLPG